MQKIAFIIALVFSLNTSAQISINSTDFISNPDTVMVSIVTDFQNINYQNTGANQNWDFSWVIIDSQRIDTFSSVSSAGLIYQVVFNNFFIPDYQASYFQKAAITALPTGGLPIALDKPISFDKVSSSKFEKVGLGVNLNGVALPIRADTIDVVYEFPMTYQDSWTSNSYLFFDLNPGFDAKFKRYQNRSSVVDGYGSITTAFGTFECIRVKSSLNYIDSLFFDLTGTGGAWIPLPSQPEIEYRWISKNNKIPVFSINVSNSLLGPAITKVEFRDSYGVANLQQDEQSLQINSFPNPASDQLNITGIQDFEIITITDLNGKVVYIDLSNNAESIALDCSLWQSGIYILSATSSEKTITKKIVLQ